MNRYTGNRYTSGILKILPAFLIHVNKLDFLYTLWIHMPMTKMVPFICAER